MARYFQDLERHLQPRRPDDIAFPHRVRHRADTPVPGPEHPRLGPLGEEVVHPADVVLVVMGEQDGRQPQALVSQGRDDRLLVARVHDQGLVAVLLAEQPDVVVVKSGDGTDDEHGGPSGWLGFEA